MLGINPRISKQEIMFFSYLSLFNFIRADFNSDMIKDSLQKKNVKQLGCINIQKENWLTSYCSELITEKNICLSLKYKKQERSD